MRGSPPTKENEDDMTRVSILRGMPKIMLLLALMSLSIPAVAEENPLLKPWSGPHGGVPPFDEVTPERLGKALEQSLESYRDDVMRIARNQEPPTFENTIAALEHAGDEFERVTILFEIYSSNMNNPEIQTLEREWSPRFSAISDEVIQNQELFGRIDAIYQAREGAGLTPEQDRLLWLIRNRFVKSGAQLGEQQKEELKTINSRLATLYTDFGQNLLADEENDKIVLDSENDLSGLPDTMVAAAAAEAEELGLEGKWVIRNTRSSADPFLTYSDRRDLRKKVWEMWVSRGDKEGKTNNNPLVTEILQLRAKKAKLLGFPTHAHWQLSDAMARNPENAMELMEKVWKPAVERVQEEVEDMEAVAAELGEEITIEPWDYRYYAEKVRKKKYDLDATELKPYLQLEKLLEAQFWVAEEMYGLTFKEVSGLPVFHKDVRVFEVTDPKGKHVGYWYFDPYAREGKRSGAWMSEYRTQEAFEKTITPIVSNNSNYIKGKPGEPVLISWDDARTYFHEFGHALHALSANVAYPTLNIGVRDYTEFQSQLLERWITTDEVIDQFLVHYQTGEPIPAELVAKIKRADTFNQGFGTTEYLASALIDMKFHTTDPAGLDTQKFEFETLQELQMPEELVMRHRSTQFSHIFSGESYAAGYYGYLWADVLASDASEAFE
ncbi:MAG: M3 family metallopeptidase, partial [Candidatus Eremiobacteraeota bacterium]|nr:M3 family metallopeptidase [Candidatus Eremiobacteraeota bacterium]